jgi:hypothetical protein
MSETPRTDEVSNRTTRKVAVWVLARDLERENAALKAELADWNNAAKHVESCHTDEIHCGCVPVLRKENTELRAELANESSKWRDFHEVNVRELRSDLSATLKALAVRTMHVQDCDKKIKRLQGLVERAKDIMRLELREAVENNWIATASTLGRWLKDAEEVTK